jgi:hypothetical protein
VEGRKILGLGRGNRMERDRMEDLVIVGRIILKWVRNKEGGTSWTELMLLRLETSERLQ